MKFLKYIMLMAAPLLAFTSCEEVDKTLAAPADGLTAPVLADHADIVIDEATLQTEVTFAWTAVDYGYPAAISYKLFGSYGETIHQIGESNTTTYTISKEALNNILVGDEMGLPENETSTIYLYVVSSLSDQNTEYDLQSNAVSLTVSTIASTSAPWMRRPLYVAGAYQGWSPATAPIIWETEENSDIYEGLVYLGAAVGTGNDTGDNLCHFKFCPNPDWTGNLGGDPNGMTNEGDPAHITTEDGLYWISVKLVPDHSTGTVSLTKVEKIGVVGDAVGSWDNDIVLSLAGMPTDPTAEDYSEKYYAAMCNQTWEAVTDNCLGGSFKFRLDGAWDKNWGGDINHLTVGGDNLNTPLTGKVRFAINFRGDVEALAADPNNPSPISASATQVE